MAAILRDEAGVHAAHVHHKSAFPCAREYACGAPERFFHDVGVGKHGNDHVATRGQFRWGRGGESARVGEFRDGLRSDVIHGERKARREQVAGHGLAHGAKADEPYMHGGLREKG